MGGRMANEEHLKILRQGVEAWNKWRDENRAIEPDLSGANLIRADLRKAYLDDAGLFGANLSGADLRKAYLSEADLSRADLSGANLIGAYLIRANLDNADLVGANLSGARLSGANLREADLREADLRRADLSEARLRGAYLGEADLSEAIVDGTMFGNVDLSAVKGLETVHHGGPSSIDVDTLYKSKGKIPEVFLRGCGVPDTMIAYIGSLVGQPIQYYSCFISYSSKDQECAERLHADLQSKGVRCWFAPEDMKTGDKILDRIGQEIGIFDKLLIVFSGHSIDSDWVETEVQAALKKERQTKRTVLFPIRLDDAVMNTSKAWAAKVRRERHITDFRGWKNHDTYQRQFARVLRDLQAVDAQEVVAPTVAQPPKAKATPTETYRTKLRQSLVTAFNLSELRDLCFDMNVDYESLSGDNKADKARELVAYCERRQIIPDLVAKCKELRPKVSWEGEYE